MSAQGKANIPANNKKVLTIMADFIAAHCPTQYDLAISQGGSVLNRCNNTQHGSTVSGSFWRIVKGNLGFLL